MGVSGGTQYQLSLSPHSKHLLHYSTEAMAGVSTTVSNLSSSLVSFLFFQCCESLLIWEIPNGRAHVHQPPRERTQASTCQTHKPGQGEETARSPPRSELLHSSRFLMFKVRPASPVFTWLTSISPSVLSDLYTEYQLVKQFEHIYGPAVRKGKTQDTCSWRAPCLNQSQALKEGWKARLPIYNEFDKSAAANDGKVSSEFIRALQDEADKAPGKKTKVKWLSENIAKRQKQAAAATPHR